MFDRQFIDNIPQIIAGLSTEVDDLPAHGRQWIFYGSQPMGQGRSDSDLDVLLVHDETGRRLHRRSALWRGMPVTIYVLTWQDLHSDGADRQYGGYFTLKLFSPFVTDTADNEPHLHALVADFLTPLAHAVALRWGGSSWTGDQLVAHAHLAFLDLYPDSASYLARRYRHRGLFQRVWAHQRAAYLTALETRGHVHAVGEGVWRYDTGCIVEDPVRERARCAARFWAWGAVLHDADPEFPDHYFGKADAAAPRAHQEEAQRFLEHVVTEGAWP